MKSLLKVVWQKFIKVIKYFKEFKFDIHNFHTWLLYLVTLLHIGGVFQVFSHMIEASYKNYSDLVAVIYIIAMSIFWSFLIINKSRNEEKELQQKIILQEYIIQDQTFEIERLKKVKPYSTVFKSIADAFSEIHQLQRYIESADPNSHKTDDLYFHMLSHFSKCCDYITYAFENIYQKQDFAVCIKINHGQLNPKNKDNRVLTLVRSLKHKKDREKDIETFHKIKDNTAFIHVLSNMQNQETSRCFVCSDLRKLNGYINSSMSLYGMTPYLDSNMSWEERVKNWKLPYVSTIVSGIYPNIEAYKRVGENKGFIGIDSVSVTEFSEYDIHILNGISEGLYNVVKSFLQFNSKNSTTKN